MYQKFLFPTDGSVDARAALGYLIPLAARTGGEVVVLEVVESAAGNVRWPVVDSIIASEKAPGVVTAQQATASDHLIEVVARLRGAGIEHVESHVRVGHVAETILKTVDELACDTIVMATHGRSAIKRFFLGSTARQIIKEAGCPVVLIPVRAGVAIAEDKNSEVAATV